MRSHLVLALAGCTTFDAGQTIQLVTDPSWSHHDRATLAAAGECWNLRFGTQIELVTEPSEAQVVIFDYDPLACWGTLGRYRHSEPGRASICPIEDLVARHAEGDFFDPDAFLFQIAEHELGHALNLPDVNVAHQASVMGRNVQPLAAHLAGTHTPLGFPAFSDLDVQGFEAANPGFVPAPACDDLGLVVDDSSELACMCP